MINLRLTNQEAIALQLLLSNRSLMTLESVPQSVKDDLARAAVANPELISAEQKLAAELDNMLQAHQMKMENPQP